MELDSTQHDMLVKTARVWVAQTFFGEMLKQMRNSPFKSELMDGGRGGQAFASQLDQHLAQRMAGSSAGDRLVRSIVAKIEGRAAATRMKVEASAPKSPIGTGNVARNYVPSAR